VTKKFIQKQTDIKETDNNNALMLTVFKYLCSDKVANIYSAMLH